MIINRYLVREISVPFLAVTVGLVFVFASYSATVFLADAAGGQLPGGIVLKLIGLKILIALEVLLPLGFYLGIIFGLGRLYGDQEMTALQAGGLSRTQMLTPLLRVALLMAVLAGLLALFARPWAYGKIYTLETAAQAQVDLSRIGPGHFQTSSDGKVVVYADRTDPQARQLNGVFLSQQDADHRLVVRAAQMVQATAADGSTQLSFRNGNLYRLDRQGTRDQTLHFGTLDLQPQISPEAVGYKRKAEPSTALLTATDTKDIAERQWRFSRPIATLFLALLGIGFARSAPRRGRSANAFAAAISFALYYNLAGIARTWVESGAVPPIPGVYWVDALVGILACVLLFRPGLRSY